MGQEMNQAAAAFAQALAHLNANGNQLATDAQAASALRTVNTIASQVLEVEQQLRALQQAFAGFRRRVVIEATPSLEGRSLVQRVLIGLFVITEGTADKMVPLTAAAHASGLGESNILSIANEQNPELFKQANTSVELTAAGLAEAERVIFGGN